MELSDLTEDRLDYKASLIAYDELIDNLDYEKASEIISSSINGQIPKWLFDYTYWTMTPSNDSK